MAEKNYNIYSYLQQNKSITREQFLKEKMKEERKYDYDEIIKNSWN